MEIYKTRKFTYWPENLVDLSNWNARSIWMNFPSMTIHAEIFHLKFVLYQIINKFINWSFKNNCNSQGCGNNLSEFIIFEGQLKNIPREISFMSIIMNRSINFKNDNIIFCGTTNSIILKDRYTKTNIDSEIFEVFWPRWYGICCEG